MICFHKPNEPNGYLSNWYLCKFTVDGVSFISAEQYMMYAKAKLFGDDFTAKRIMRTENQRDIRALGRQVRNFDEAIWNANKEELVYKGLYAKFSQNLSLRERLLDTGDMILAESTTTDKIWGTGVSMYDPCRYDVNKWTGQSLLGNLLMKVRADLRKESE